MKIIDLMFEREALRLEMRHEERYYDTVMSQDDARKRQDKIREKNAENRKKLDQIDALSNRINEALATSFSKVQGTEMSLATMLDYIRKVEKSIHPFGDRVLPPCNPAFNQGFGGGIGVGCRPFQPLSEPDDDEEVRYRYVSSSGYIGSGCEIYCADDEVVVNPDDVNPDYHGVNKKQLYLDILGEFLKQVSSIDM